MVLASHSNLQSGFTVIAFLRKHKIDHPKLSKKPKTSSVATSNHLRGEEMTDKLEGPPRHRIIRSKPSAQEPRGEKELGGCLVGPLEL